MKAKEPKIIALSRFTYHAVFSVDCLDAGESGRLPKRRNDYRRPSTPPPAHGAIGVAYHGDTFEFFSVVELLGQSGSTHD